MLARTCCKETVCLVAFNACPHKAEGGTHLQVGCCTHSSTDPECCHAHGHVGDHNHQAQAQLHQNDENTHNGLDGLVDGRSTCCFSERARCHLRSQGADYFAYLINLGNQRFSVIVSALIFSLVIGCPV